MLTRKLFFLIFIVNCLIFMSLKPSFSDSLYQGMEVTVKVYKEGNFAVSYYKDNNFMRYKFENFTELKRYILDNFITDAKYYILFIGYGGKSMTLNSQQIVDQLDVIFSQKDIHQVLYAHRTGSLTIRYMLPKKNGINYIDESGVYYKLWKSGFGDEQLRNDVKQGKLKNYFKAEEEEEEEEEEKVTE